MDTINAFGFKQRKYMPVFPKATGKTTVYIEGYPCEDAELEKLRSQLAKSQRE